jgi:teichuronic acid exporter
VERRTIVQTLKQKLSNRFVQNLGWLGASQLVNRVFRLATTVVTARVFTEEDFGLVALIMTVHQFILTFTATGLQEKIAQVPEDQVEECCNTVYWLNWMLSGALFVLQCLAAFPIAWFYHNDRLILPICVLGLIYLIRAVSEVQSGLIQRQNRLRVFAISDAVGNMATNSLCVGMALAGFGFWAMVLPQILLAPIWNVIINRSCAWKPGQFSLKGWREVFDFGKNIVGISLLSTVRENIDYLLVGKFLDLRELGLYYFAFNAGLGISMNILNVFNSALFPYLTSAQGDVDRLKKYYFDGLKTMALTSTPLILLQAGLAHFYVPLVFGNQWTEAIPILVLICLSALPRPFYSAASRLLWAIDRTDLDFRLNVIFSVILTTAITIGLFSAGSIGVAWAVLLTHLIVLPIFTWWTSRYVFKTHFFA